MQISVLQAHREITVWIVSTMNKQLVASKSESEITPQRRFRPRCPLGQILPSQLNGIKNEHAAEKTCICGRIEGTICCVSEGYSQGKDRKPTCLRYETRKERREEKERFKVFDMNRVSDPLTVHFLPTSLPSRCPPALRMPAAL